MPWRQTEPYADKNTRENVRGYPSQYFDMDKNCTQARISDETENIGIFDESDDSSVNENSPAAACTFSIFLLGGVN